MGRAVNERGERAKNMKQKWQAAEQDKYAMLYAVHEALEIPPESGVPFSGLIAEIVRLREKSRSWRRWLPSFRRKSKQLKHS